MKVTGIDAVYYTVVNMGNWVHGLTAIGTTWRILRDIGNIILIFGFMMAGIATIINYDLYGWSKKALPPATSARSAAARTRMPPSPSRAEGITRA